MRWIMIIVSLCFFLEIPAIAGTISGNVKNDDGMPVRKVKITLEYLGTSIVPAPKYSTMNDENGAFAFGDLPTGIYRLTAERAEWNNWQQEVSIGDTHQDRHKEVQITLTLKPLYQILGIIQLSSLTYVLLFGILILVLNFFIADAPTTGVAVGGWLFIAASIVIGWVKLNWLPALFVTFLGTALGSIIHKIGTKLAQEKCRQREEKHKEEAKEVAAEQERLAMMVGKEGRALSDLKPYGNVSVEGTVIEAKSVGGLIVRETVLTVIGLEGGKILVGKVSGSNERPK